ncbi:MAG: hypothetical protein CL886_00820 [Dehalococcoidia bacterium]|nr:hypothetical protein [Dehalococcoidia bacterium]|tara:strand:+ start:12135 stop:13298 length:1164 start_codon:yes stop_codon:yes gene_type:complete
MNKTADAVVVGGGVIGCSVLYHLCAQNMNNVTLLEKDVLGSGSTGRSQTICRTHYSNVITSTMARDSLNIFKNFSEIVGGESGFVNTGYIVVVDKSDEEGLRKNLMMQQALGINTSQIDSDQLRDIAPMVCATRDELLAWEPDSGYADSYRVTTSYANRARDMGADIYLRSPVIGIEILNGAVKSVTTPDGTIETSTIIICCGPWSKQILNYAKVEAPLSTVRHQIATIARPVDKIPDHPIIGDIAQSFSLRPEGTSMTLIGFGEDEAQVDSYNQGVDLDSIPSVLSRLIHRMPDMEQSYFRGGWSGLFTITPDWHPILDEIPGIRGLYCAVGFSGHGFKLAPSIGELMSKLVMGDEISSVDIDQLRFTRFEQNDVLASSYHYNVLA